MQKFIINGPVELAGEIAVKGAKNQALKIIPASILSREKITIKNLPQIEDVEKSLELLADLGAEIDRNGSTVLIDPKNINKIELNPLIANKFRSSLMFVSPLLARFGEVKFPHPGGCVIGADGRPIDVFLDGYRAMGAEIEEDGKFYHIKTNRGLQGADFFFSKLISVTGTEALMMAATLASGTTKLRNCALEPEIAPLAAYLNEQGAKIEGAGTSEMTITGVKEIGGGTFTIIPDRIETGSFAIMAAATGSEITITDCEPEHIRVLLEIFKKIDVPFAVDGRRLTIKKAKDIKPYNLKTHEYPGFPTDLQAPFTVLMTRALGRSLIHETIYDRRLMFTDSLAQMGANIIMCDPHRIVINGPFKLRGRKLTSPDLRAGIALLIAAMMAEGRTEIDNIYQIDRGYEKIEDRLNQIGAGIARADIAA